jgi:uncharacterized membrane protein YdjX (TVP38/TMEM64 family)
MNSGLKKALLISFIAISILIIVWYFQLHSYISLASFQKNKLYLKAAVEQHYWRSVFIFIATYIGIIAVFIPGMPPMTLLSGFLFDFWPGFIYSGIGTSVGSTCSFLVIRYALSNTLRGKYAEKLKQFNEKIAKQGTAYYLLTMQLIGLIPYFIINTLAALAHVSSFTFLWTTFVGSIPMLFIYTFAGKRLSSLSSLSEVFSPSILLLVIAFTALLLLPIGIRFLRRSDN